MELTLEQVATATETSARYVRQAVARGDLAALRRIGSVIVVDDLAAQAWDRARARGRRWTPEVRRAAFELLEYGATQRLSSSERSRLRARLRTVGARQLAHLSGGLGGQWARFRALSPMGTLVGSVPVGVSSEDLEAIGMVGGTSRFTFRATESLDRFELDNDVILDASGDLCVVERPPDESRIRALLDTYLLGSARESRIAAAFIEGVSHASGWLRAS